MNVVVAARAVDKVQTPDTTVRNQRSETRGLSQDGETKALRNINRVRINSDTSG